MKLLRRLGLCVGVLLAGSSLAAGPASTPLRLATEEWPPFFSATLPDNGLTGALLQAVLTRMGHVAHIDYYPWKRAMALGLDDPRYAGAVAVFSTPERERLCHLSSPVGSRQTVLAFLVDRPVPAATLAELHGQRIGTVGGYSNGEQFDSLVRSGVLEVEPGINDDINLRKLMARRFAVIVIEKRMLRYLLSAGRYTPAERARVATSERLFEERPVHVCFQRTAEGLKLQQAFGKAARGVDLVKVERDYWHSVVDVAPRKD